MSDWNKLWRVFRKGRDAAIGEVTGDGLTEQQIRQIVRNAMRDVWDEYAQELLTEIQRLIEEAKE